MNANKKYSPGKTGTIVDSAHIAIGILVVVLTVVGISDPDRFMAVFPLIFFLAGILSTLSGWYAIVTYQKKPGRRFFIVLSFVIAVLMLILFVLGALSIWF